MSMEDRARQRERARCTGATPRKEHNRGKLGTSSWLITLLSRVSCHMRQQELLLSTEIVRLASLSVCEEQCLKGKCFQLIAS